MNGEKIVELVARLEKATGPDRELDHQVLIACGWMVDSDERGEIHHYIDPKGALWAPSYLPEPTQSIDAALSLVPEGYQKTLWLGADNSAHVELKTPAHKLGPVAGHEHSIAIALCIAALRARSNLPIEDK